MGKSAVYGKIIPFMADKIGELKRLSLSFEKIFSAEYTQNPKLPITEEVKGLLKNRFELIDYLQDKGIIEVYQQTNILKSDLISKDELSFVKRFFKTSIGLGDKRNLYEQSREFFIEKLIESYITEDIFIRIDALELTRHHNSEFYPILQTPDFFVDSNKKTEIVQFVLGNIPEPDKNISWDHIVEFRSDPDVRNKYLALINWINKVAASSSSLSDIQDEYAYLYSEYMKAFNLHKMKYNNSSLEVLVSAGVDFISSIATGHFVPAIRNLLQIRSTKISLLQEENSLPGKEIAYIYHATSKFGDK